MRVVKLGRRINAMWVVESGQLEQVIIEAYKKSAKVQKSKPLKKMLMQQRALLLAKPT